MSRVRVLRTGERHGRLVVAEDRTQGSTPVLCVCDCGTRTSIAINDWGRTESCGCLVLDRVREANTTHGFSGTPTYRTWVGMWRRCTQPHVKAFPDYGGRGITVCDRWKDFAAFLADMGERPEGKSLDRIDVNGNYEPENCRWATAAEQRANQRPRRPQKPRLSCSRGHKFTDETTRETTQGQRLCRPCEQAYQDGYRAGLRAARQEKGAVA